MTTMPHCDCSDCEALPRGRSRFALARELEENHSYILEEKRGDGHFGVVYAARRSDGSTQRLAIKVRAV